MVFFLICCDQSLVVEQKKRPADNESSSFVTIKENLITSDGERILRRQRRKIRFRRSSKIEFPSGFHTKSMEKGRKAIGKSRVTEGFYDTALNEASDV